MEENPTGDDQLPGDTGTTEPGSGDTAVEKPRLGDCSPGIPLSQATSCEWYAGQTCYPTQEAACNCICPANVAEVYCIGYLPEDGVANSVYCSGG